ncbi:hypothetical protein EYF80_040796 [Liparis tanakae]|uniref:Uncharacterized protein n=1 Tax=Liparis tanakae TaxID=230148 RepID=A0A4Z2G895_9TELE|nr:hypothetical protein EYF80_040796 [Liparis tanakae]
MRSWSRGRSHLSDALQDALDAQSYTMSSQTLPTGTGAPGGRTRSERRPLTTTHREQKGSDPRGSGFRVRPSWFWVQGQTLVVLGSGSESNEITPPWRNTAPRSARRGADHRAADTGSGSP